MGRRSGIAFEVHRPTGEASPLIIIKEGNTRRLQEELIDDYKSYIYHHPDITALVSDFLQSVLIMKPENVIEYAAEFFAPFDSQTADRALFRFAEEKIPVPKPNLALQ